MKFTRRTFIRSSSAAAFAAALGHIGGHAIMGKDTGSPGKRTDAASYLLREHFEPFVGTDFRVTSKSGETSTIRLREATDLTVQLNLERGYSGDSFRLGFVASRRNSLPEGIYNFSHENLGRFSFFIEPVGGKETRYEVIVNRVC